MWRRVCAAVICRAGPRGLRGAHNVAVPPVVLSRMKSLLARHAELTASLETGGWGARSCVASPPPSPAGALFQFSYADVRTCAELRPVEHGGASLFTIP